MKDRKIRKVEDFIVYQKAMELSCNFIEEDLPVLQKTLAGRELAREQVRSPDSICSNMEEGYGRKAGKELKHFFTISRGSTGESKGRYLRCRNSFQPILSREESLSWKRFKLCYIRLFQS